MFTKKQLALCLAVIHHGLANFAPDAVPARKETVITTSNEFLKYMSDAQDSNRR